MISRRNRIIFFVAIPAIAALAALTAPLTAASTPKAAAQSTTQNATSTPTPALPATGSYSKIVPHYHNAPPYLVSTQTNNDVYLSIYKLCDGPNLIYYSMGGNAHNYTAPATSSQVQFDSPECK